MSEVPPSGSKSKARRRISGHDGDILTKLPAHRPSRRDEIVDAAITVFALKGFIDASISDVAEAADVAVTAVYYHFAGKEDLYGAAIGKVLSTVDEIVASVRADDVPADSDTLFRVIDAVWDWVDENPLAATLMHLHTPAATRQSAARRREFDELHVQRAFAYIGEPPAPAHMTAHRLGAATLAVRTLVDLHIAIHPMRLPGGPLSGCSPKAIRQAVKELSTRLLGAV